MKTIALVRHAKSSWKDATLPDMDRPLNRRGRVDAPEMGRRLQAQPFIFRKVYSSPAVRATETADWLMPSLGLKAEQQQPTPALYTFNYEEILGWLRSLEAVCDHFVVICHNPAITDLVNFLTLSQISKIPTCGIAILQLNIRSWGNLGAGTAELMYLDFPKSVSGKVLALESDG
ncbi:MAG: histidine phosphatase family protein [Porticoccaceae bacterium]